MNATNPARNIIRLTKLILVIAILAALAFGVYKVFCKEKDPVSMEKAKVADIKTMAELCTMDIYTDIPVKGRIGSKHFFGRQTLQGSISFDIESISDTILTDSLRIYLPSENVRMLESTRPNSFRIIDTWNDNLLQSSTLTNAEETRIKQLARAKAIASLYADGTVAKARSEAKQRLAEFLKLVSGHQVEIIDTTPRGANYKSYVREVKRAIR